MKTLCSSVSIDENKNLVAPAFLVEADSYAKSCKKVMYFLETTSLVKYDSVAFSTELAFSASDHAFWDMLSNVLEKNKQSINTLIDELQRSGYRQISELAEMKQGYLSKTLHVLVHFLDGFIGVDSSFYNIIEDSHQISDSLHKKIKQSPQNYWLLKGNAENPQGFL
jgi:predicted DNA-binding ribbon-helix-helix protein